MLLQWEKLEADAAAGLAVEGSVTADRPGFGPLSSYWLYYPDGVSHGSSASTGTVTFWNSWKRIDAFVSQALDVGIGGVFTWTTTSDAADWRVHTHLRHQLDGPN